MNSCGDAADERADGPKYLPDFGEIAFSPVMPFNAAVLRYW
jgi:hypothetical protein